MTYFCPRGEINGVKGQIWGGRFGTLNESLGYHIYRVDTQVKKQGAARHRSELAASSPQAFCELAASNSKYC